VNCTGPGAPVPEGWRAAETQLWGAAALAVPNKQESRKDRAIIVSVKCFLKQNRQCALIGSG